MSSSGNQRLSVAIEQYLTSRQGRHSPVTMSNDTIVLRRFLAAVGDIQVRNLTADHVERFLLTLLTPHKTRDGQDRPAISASTFNYYRSRVAQLAGFLQTRGLLRDDVMARVHPMKRARRIRQQPSPATLWAMLDNTKDPRDRAILATACNTGLRASEISALKVADVDLEGLTLRVRISKSKTEDDLPITSDLATELVTWLDIYRRRSVSELDRIGQPSDYLFPARRGGNYGWRTMPDGAKRRYRTTPQLDPLRPALRLHLIAQAALRSVGLEHRHEGIHTIRRSVARAFFDSLVAEDGYDGALRVTSAFLHHTNVSTTETYLGLTSETRKRDTALRGRSLLGPRPGTESAEVAQTRG